MNSLDIALQALRKVQVEEILLPVLVQLIIMILAARIFALVFRRLGQPGVVGEIAAGLVLGPSLLGNLPMIRAVFHPSLPEVPPELADQVFQKIFTVLSQLGLILLLFLVGLEFDFRHLRGQGGSALGISLMGIALPFALGLSLAPMLASGESLWGPQEEAAPPLLGLALFLGTALSITALPVLGRMMVELNITRTRLGTVTITGAAVDDASGWILLTSVVAIVRAQFEVKEIFHMVGETAFFALFMLLAAKPFLRYWVRGILAKKGELGINAFALLLIGIFICAVTTNRIGIFAIFGAFFLGAILSGETAFREAVHRRLRDFVTVFFLPIFFTYTGLRTDIGTLESTSLWLWCGVVLAAAIFGKLVGCALAARLCGFSTREACCIGALMNTRGLMELVVVNVGYDLGVIPRSVFCMLVIMALVTTVLTTPLLLLLVPGTELEPFMKEAGWLRTKARKSSKEIKIT